MIKGSYLLENLSMWSFFQITAKNGCFSIIFGYFWWFFEIFSKVAWQIFIKIPESLEISKPYIKLGLPHFETCVRMRFWPQNIKNLHILVYFNCFRAKFETYEYCSIMFSSICRVYTPFTKRAENTGIPDVILTLSTSCWGQFAQNSVGRKV